jgi:hypothetical protein
MQYRVQTAFAVKKFKSHRQVGVPSEIMALMQAWRAALRIWNQFCYDPESFIVTSFKVLCETTQFRWQ